MYFLIKALASGVIIATVSEIAKRSPAFGALTASLPVISILAMIWLWRDGGDAERVAQYAGSTFWYVLPSLPMFLVLPMLLRRGVDFWPALIGGMLMTAALYGLMIVILARFGVRL